MSAKCSNCKNVQTVSEVTADIEYVDSEFSLVVSSKSVKHSKEIFNELFEKVQKSKKRKTKAYIG